MDRLLYGFVHYESRFCHFTETCGSYPAHDVFNFHDVCKDRVVYPYFMPILILSVVFGSLRHLLVIISPYSMSTVIYSHYINLSIFGPVKKVINLVCWSRTKRKLPYVWDGLGGTMFLLFPPYLLFLTVCKHYIYVVGHSY